MAGNPVQPNEVAVIPFEVFNGPFPLEGPKAIPFICQFTGSIGAIPIDFTGIFQRGLITLIQTVFIDNSNNTQETTLVANGTNQTIIAPSQSQGYYNIAVTNPPRFIVSSGGGVNVPMQFLNVAVTSSIWFPAGGGQVVIPNNTIEANLTGAPAPPSPYTLSAILDAIMGSAVGDIIYRGAGGWLVLAAGSNGQVLELSTGIPSWQTPSSGGGSIAPSVLIEDQQPQNTNDGTFTQGAWQSRTLNTLVINVGGICSLSLNQFSLPIGSYYIEANAPGVAVNQHKLRLFNVTDSTQILTGTNEYASQNSGNATTALLKGTFTIANPKTFALQHYCLATQGLNGFGSACNIAGTHETYAQVCLWKTA